MDPFKKRPKVVEIEKNNDTTFLKNVTEKFEEKTRERLVKISV